MKAILTKQPGGSDQLHLGDHQMPIPSEDQILVKVMATALNRADILQREGKYPPPHGASSILGIEIAGEVVSLGANVNNWQTKNRVFGIVPGGGYAQYAVIHKNMAMSIPDNLDYTEAASIPEAFLTAYQAIVWLANTKPQETVLVHAGGSGVGTAAIQLVNQLGASCIVTASAGKHKKCYELGAKYCIDYKQDNFQEIIKSKYGGADVIIDFLGASNFNKNIKSLNNDGRLIMLALMGGAKVDNINLSTIVINRLKILGSTLRSRKLDYQIQLTKGFWSFASDCLRIGKLHATIDKVYPWEDVALAHQYMEANKNTGKIVLTIQ